MDKSTLLYILSIPLLIILTPGYILLILLGAKPKIIFTILNDIMEGNE